MYSTVYIIVRKNIMMYPNGNIDVTIFKTNYVEKYTQGTRGVRRKNKGLIYFWRGTRHF